MSVRPAVPQKDAPGPSYSAEVVTLLSRPLPRRNEVIMPRLRAACRICIPDNCSQGCPRVSPRITTHEVSERIVAAASAPETSAAIVVSASGREVLALTMAGYSAQVRRTTIHPQTAICVVGVLRARPRWRVPRLESQAHISVEHHLSSQRVRGPDISTNPLHLASRTHARSPTDGNDGFIVLLAEGPGVRLADPEPIEPRVLRQ